MSSEAKSAQEVAANRRRQAYFRRRAQVQKMHARGSGIPAHKMKSERILGDLIGELCLIEEWARGGASVENYGRIQRALDMAIELHTRGAQLQIDLTELVADSPTG